jgi:hypothetical protein
LAGLFFETRAYRRAPQDEAGLILNAAQSLGAFALI